MSTIFNIMRAFIFLMLASFASTALSVTVSSESGGASLDGTWGFEGCFRDFEEYGDVYYEEYLIFKGNEGESRLLGFGTDSNCGSGTGSGGTLLGSEMFDLTNEGDKQSDGWEDTPPPPCQNTGECTNLDPDPKVTELAISIPGEDDEIIRFYIDDTGGDDNNPSWLLYRTVSIEVDEEEVPTFTLSAEEPLYKTDISPIPVPAAVWLFGTALIGFVGMSRRRKVA